MYIWCDSIYSLKTNGKLVFRLSHLQQKHTQIKKRRYSTYNTHYITIIHRLEYKENEFKLKYNSRAIDSWMSSVFTICFVLSLRLSLLMRWEIFLIYPLTRVYKKRELKEWECVYGTRIKSVKIYLLSVIWREIVRQSEKWKENIILECSLARNSSGSLNWWVSGI